jgi:predicted metal-dependent enzyme (double-stranded beta helix superfamily)
MHATEPVTELVSAIRTALARPHAAPSERIAATLGTFLAHPGLLAAHQRLANDLRYAQHVLHVEPDESFSIVALVWQPGQATRIHDHVAWCTVGVYEGCERETTYAAETCATGERRLYAVGTRDNAPGAVDSLACGNDIHHVFNPGPSLAISLHVYGANVKRLGSSVHRWYDEKPEAANWAI